MKVLGTAVGLVIWMAGLAAAAPSDGVAELRVKQTPDEVRRFWTEERMKQALKNPMSPLRDGEASAKRSVPALDEIKLSPPSGPVSGAVWKPMNLLRDGEPDAKIACPVTKYESFFDTDCMSSAICGISSIRISLRFPTSAPYCTHNAEPSSLA